MGTGCPTHTWTEGKNRDPQDSAWYDIPTVPTTISKNYVHADGEDAIPLNKQDLGIHNQTIWIFVCVDFFMPVIGVRIVSNTPSDVGNLRQTYRSVYLSIFIQHGTY